MLEKDDKIGEYKLEKFLGRGQFGEVWLAEKQLQVSTRKVRHALKFLFSAGEEIDLKAAEAEVDTWIEAGGHPNVMSVLDMLTHRGHIIIVSEFAAGGSLKSWLTSNGGKAPTEEKALELMRGILRGIEHLHSKSVVHRDLKPDNILLQGEFPRITDFGISRIVDESTMSTKAVGSPAYMSPESFNGNKSPQNDIWSAGVIFYEMLAGDYPFSHDTIYGLVNTILEDEAKPLPETVSPELRKIVETALQKDRANRYQTAREMLTAVERAGYDLQAKNERNKEWIKTLKINEKKDLPPKQSEINTVFYEKQIAETQPVKAKRTDDKEIEKTKDWRELERQRVELEQSDLSRIGRELAQNQGEKKSKTALLAIIGGILGIALIGVLYWSMSGYTSVLVTNPPTNSNQSNFTNNSNKSTVPTVPTAPTGMAYVPGGEFMMGRDDGKSDAEKPAHKVSVSPFFMDVYDNDG